jgi:hypothetical protein
MPFTKRTPIGDVVKDFEQSKAPQFKGKSKAKRREMAIAAALSKRDNKKMTKEELKKLVKEVFSEVTYVGAAAADEIAKDPKFQAVKDKNTAINTLKKGGAVELGETKSSKYDNDPSLKGGQKNLPDALQAGIIKAAKKKGVKMNESELEEGKLKKIFTGAALFAALLAGNKALTDSSPVLKKLKAEYEQAEAKGDKEKMKELKDKIAKQEIAIETGVIDKSIQEIDEDLDVGHQDNEPGMLVSDLYRIAKYATELGQMVTELGKLEGEVDFPHWWQAKIIKAKDYMTGAKHYLDGELKTGQAFDND